jgi:NTE family protein
MSEDDRTRALVLSGGASHGAFQAGAIAALEEIGWEADIVSGTSVGSINGAAYAMNMDPERLIQVWEDVTTEDVYQLRPFRDWFSIWKWNYLFDTSPLRGFLEEFISKDELSSSDRTSLCCGTDVKTGELTVFSNHTDERVDPLRCEYDVREMDLNSILSSSAIPGLFPWIEGKWDGSLQLRTPLKPVVKLGADEIVIVNIDYSFNDRFPEGIKEVLLKITNITSACQLNYDLNLLRRRNSSPQYRTIDTLMIKPEERLPYSKLNFSSPKMSEAVWKGYFRTVEEMEAYNGLE